MIGVFSGGKKLVNEFCEFFRAGTLKTEVCHGDIKSRKVILLFCSIETVRQSGMRENALHGYNWDLVSVVRHQRISVAVIHRLLFI